MIIKKLLVKNYKLLKDVAINFNDKLNVLVGDNDSGKSTILEAINIALTGKINRISLERQLNASLFNSDIRNEYISSDKAKLPEIIIELYCEGEAEYKGTNNLLGENCPGIQVKIDFNELYENILKTKLLEEEITDIPVEFYRVKFNYFNGSPVVFRDFPINSAFIDASKGDLENIQSRFVTTKIDEYISKDEQVELDSIYHKYLGKFKTDPAISDFKTAVSGKISINDRNIGFGIKDEFNNSWKEQVTLLLENEPLSSVGYGTQNIIKIGIALANVKDKSNCLLVEEPENNLSYINMSKLIDMIKSTNSQVFVSTHSSFVANKMSLNNLILINKGNAISFNKINPETYDYFLKLPGYNTLRVALSEKVLLVEGPTEELVISKYYLDEFGKMPIECGVDIVCVNGLSFKRYLDILVLMNKHAVVITDNDHSIEDSITRKYKDYDSGLISFFYETNEDLNTFEPSILNANSIDDKAKSLFKSIIQCEDKTDKEAIGFMQKNKTEWALRVFNSKDKIIYPQYIKDAIKKLG